VLTPPKTDSGEKPAAKDDAGPQQHTTFFRGDEPAAKMPKVLLSPHEEALCRVKVGDAMPAIELPNLSGGDKAILSDLRGKKATVVVFWKGDRRMALEQIADLGPDVSEPFGKDGVNVVGIAVNEPAASAKEAIEKAGAKFTNLIDADGKALALVGKERLPRTYVLDANGKIVWFDITYSLTTRRELHDALRVLTGEAGK
jgi:peroxiredoxin